MSETVSRFQSNKEKEEEEKEEEEKEEEDVDVYICIVPFCEDTTCCYQYYYSIRILSLSFCFT